MFNRKTIAVGLSAVAVLVGGAMGVSAVSGASEGTESLAEVGAPAGDALPEGFRRIFAEPNSGVAKEFGLDASTVRRVQLTSTDESVWLAPGANGGLCISSSSGAYSCTHARAQGATLTLLPAPPREYGQAIIAAQEAGLTGDDADAYVRKATADAPEWHGSALYVGYAPPGTTSASLIESDGSVIASTEPHDLIFDFTVPDIATASPSSVQLNGGPITEPLTLPDIDSMFGGR